MKYDLYGLMSVEAQVLGCVPQVPATNELAVFSAGKVCRRNRKGLVFQNVMLLSSAGWRPTVHVRCYFWECFWHLLDVPLHCAVFSRAEGGRALWLWATAQQEAEVLGSDCCSRVWSSFLLPTVGRHRSTLGWKSKAVKYTLHLLRPVGHPSSVGIFTNKLTYLDVKEFVSN